MKLKTSCLCWLITVSTLFACSTHSAEQPNTFVTTSSNTPAAEAEVLQVWELPIELKEISGNVLIDDSRMACIEDNEGTIHIYNLTSKKIESSIVFAGAGDYEAIARVGKLYYVLRSDGFLYEVQPIENGKPEVKTYNLPLDASSDTESLFYDKERDRLLVAVKEKDPNSNTGKGIYSFDLPAKTMNTTAVFMIDGNIAKTGGKKSKKGGSIKPSEILIHPKSSELYILNGPKSQLLIADEKGAIKSTIQLPKDVFPQPEGMCFSPSGDFYISSEDGKKGTAVIVKVKL